MIRFATRQCCGFAWYCHNFHINYFGQNTNAQSALAKRSGLSLQYFSANFSIIRSIFCAFAHKVDTIFWQLRRPLREVGSRRGSVSRPHPGTGRNAGGAGKTKRKGLLPELKTVCQSMQRVLVERLVLSKIFMDRANNHKTPRLTST